MNKLLILIILIFLTSKSYSDEFDWDKSVPIYTYNKEFNVWAEFSVNEAGDLIYLVISRGYQTSSLAYVGRVSGSSAYLRVEGKVYPPPNVVKNFVFIENGVIHRGEVVLKRGDMWPYIQGYLDGIRYSKKSEK